jgi:predicted aspartyl protease/tetratricopeptide (TPR) repeat protein
MLSRRLAPWLAPALLLASPAFAECTATNIAELKVTMEGLRPIVPSTLNGTDVKFIADSGAFYSLLSPSVAAQLGLDLAPTPSNFILRGIGGAATTSITKVKSFGLAGSTIPDVTFLVGGSDTGHAGLLGMNVLGLFDTDFDLAGGIIRLVRTKDCGKASLAYWAGDKVVQMLSLIPPDARNPHIEAYVKVNGVRMRALFDTGAPSSMLTLNAAARAGVTPTSAQAAGTSRGLGRNVTQSWIAPFDSLMIGEEQIHNIRLRISEVPGAPFDMLLGADFFLSHHIFVSRATGRMFLTYNGGPVFNLNGGGPARAPATATADSADAPALTDPDALARRGAAAAARRDFAGAMPDLTRAIELAPNEPRYRVARARAYLSNRQPLLAKTDLDAAIRLKPEDPDALLARASLYLMTDHRDEALADIDTVARTQPKEANLRLALAELYDRAKAHAQAIGEYDLWLAIHNRSDSHSPQALNGRCWSRALLGQDLAKALEDCNAAVRLAPKAAGYLDSRGLVRLRMGDFDRAIADYDAALAMQPRIAWSLYGRGLARQRKGMKAQGDADIAAAVAINPGIADEAKRYGVSPST